MPAGNPRPNLGAGVLRPVGIVSVEFADRSHGCVTELLLFLASFAGPEAFKPVLIILLQKFLDALSLSTGSLLQIRHEAGREMPTINLDLHAPIVAEP
jgi:hypothetical protein